MLSTRTMAKIMIRLPMMMMMLKAASFHTQLVQSLIILGRKLLKILFPQVYANIREMWWVERRYFRLLLLPFTMAMNMDAIPIADNCHRPCINNNWNKFNCFVSTLSIISNNSISILIIIYLYIYWYDKFLPLRNVFLTALQYWNVNFKRAPFGWYLHSSSNFFSI